MIPNLLTSLITVALWRSTMSCTNYNDPACTEINPLDGDYFLNEWVIKIRGNSKDAERIAQEVGLKYMAPVEKYKGYHKMQYSRIPYRNKLPYDKISQILQNHKEIELAGQRYVWQPTVFDVNNYEDMVGCERPTDVQITHFDSDKGITKRELDDDFYRPDKLKKAEPVDGGSVPSLRTVVDLEEQYEEKRLKDNDQDEAIQKLKDEKKNSPPRDQINEANMFTNDEKSPFLVHEPDDESEISEVIAEAEETFKQSEHPYARMNLDSPINDQEKTDQNSVFEQEEISSHFNGGAQTEAQKSSVDSPIKLQYDTPTTEQFAQ